MQQITVLPVAVNQLKKEKERFYVSEIQLIDAETLFFKPLDRPGLLIEGLLSNGLAILSGDSKIGKSWMVLWFCLKIASGEPIWGRPTSRSSVIYLALEDKEWRIQQRMQELTDEPPDNLRFGFSCGKLGKELEGQIESVLKEHPETGALFIDTLQMVRDNVSSRVNAYAQDYRDLSALKKIADQHNMCIFVVHHNRKERDNQNIFNDASGATGLTGVADTCMVLRKEDRFGDQAVLSITGRDVEEQKLKLCMNKNVWEVTEELDAADLRKERVPPFLFRVVDLLMEQKQYTGTVSELLLRIGEEAVQPNAASKYITKYYSEVFRPLGIRFQFRRTSGARLILLTMDDDDDGNDGKTRSEVYASLKQANDDRGSLPDLSSQSSLASWLSFQKEVDDDDQLPF